MNNSVKFLCNESPYSERRLKYFESANLASSRTESGLNTCRSPPTNTTYRRVRQFFHGVIISTCIRPHS